MTPVADLFAVLLALAFTALAGDLDLFPALLIAPVIVLGMHLMLGLYGSRAAVSRGEESARASRLIARLIAAAALTWFVSLLTTLTTVEQLEFFFVFVGLSLGAMLATLGLLRRADSPERWILIGDEETSARLREFEPLRRFATIVETIPASKQMAGSVDRTAALEVVDRCNADRVVIASRHADDDYLLGMVRAFRSLGVAVSMLPRPLDLLEAPGDVTPSRVGGLALFEVKAPLGRSGALYSGPDRRGNRQTKISVVVPALNEERNIGNVLKRLPAGLHEVILVDGHSADRTIEAALDAAPEIKVVVQSGRGKGAALRSGFAAVTGNLVVMLDADGSADPAEIPRFVEALENGADFAKGSRFVGDGGSADITRIRRAGNRFLSGTANALHQTRFTDLCYGYNAFWSRCLPFISLDVPGFEVETLINLRVAAAGMRIAEVPSFESSRVYGQSNLKTFSDGFRVLKTILIEAVDRRRASRVTPRPTDGRRSPEAFNSLR